MHLNIGPRSKVTPCCHFDEEADSKTSADIRYIPITDVHKTKEWYTLQKQLMTGEKPIGCKKCYEDEDSGIKSQREVAIDLWGDNVSETSLKSLELKLGAKCNLACRTCSSDSSNKWLKEESLLWFGHINKDWIRKKQSKSDWVSNESFWKNLHAASSKIERITFTGGEPMLINEHFQYLEWLSSKDIKPKLDYITNATVPLEKVKNIFDKFDEVSMSMSIDAVGKLSNYIRTGSEWDDLFKNIIAYTKYFKKRGWHLDIASTVSVLNANNIHKMAKFVDRIDIHWHLNFLRYPEFMSILNLSDNARSIIAENITNITNDISPDKARELYKIIRFLSSSNEKHGLDDIPIWRHIAQRDSRHNRVNPIVRTFSKADPEWWDVLIMEE